MSGGKRKEFRLADEITWAIGIGFLVWYVLSVLLSVFFRAEIDMFVGAVVIGVLTLKYVFRLIKINEKFNLKNNKKYKIDKVKDFFGSPINIITDKDVTYYVFTEDMATIGRGTHIFTTDKNGFVIKHEIE